MRIAYIVDWRLGRHSGVNNKVMNQVSEWRLLGHKVKLIFITLSKQKKKHDDEIIINNTFLQYVNYPFVMYLHKILSIAKVKKTIKTNKIDIIYYRNSLWYPRLSTILRMVPTVIEINTLEKEEYKVSSIIKRVIFLLFNKITLRSAKAFVVMTNEIGKDLKRNLPDNNDILVLPNSFKVPLRLGKNKNEYPSIIFVGTMGLKWHGWEKLIILANYLPSLEINIVGQVNTEKYLIPDNIIMHGTLHNEQLEKMYRRVSVGISTLSLYKKNMIEACPLKTSEYIANGLPVIIGYKDKELEGKNYILDIGNYKNNIIDNIERIQLFVNKWTGKKIDDKSRFVVDSQNIELKRINFFKKVIENSQ